MQSTSTLNITGILESGALGQNLTFVNRFLPDLFSGHPRLDNCSDVYMLEEDDEFYIQGSGLLHHVNTSVTTEFYCIESFQQVTTEDHFLINQLVSLKESDNLVVLRPVLCVETRSL